MKTHIPLIPLWWIAVQEYRYHPCAAHSGIRCHQRKSAFHPFAPITKSKNSSYKVALSSSDHWDAAFRLLSSLSGRWLWNWKYSICSLARPKIADYFPVPDFTSEYWKTPVGKFDVRRNVSMEKFNFCSGKDSDLIMVIGFRHFLWDIEMTRLLIAQK